MMKKIEMGNPREVEALLKDGNFLDLDLQALRREHAELIAFNTVIDRQLKAEKKNADLYRRKVSIIADLLRDPSNPDMTLKAIQTVIERIWEHD